MSLHEFYGIMMIHILLCMYVYILINYIAKFSYNQPNRWLFVCSFFKIELALKV